MRPVTGMGGVDDKESFAYGLSLAHEPGTRWAYSNEGAFLLSPVMTRAAGEPIEDYAQRRLFGPLGMRQTRLHVYPKGQAWTHADMETTPRDLARIGLLMLQRRKWGRAQLVPQDGAVPLPDERANPPAGARKPWSQRRSPRLPRGTHTVGRRFVRVVSRQGATECAD